ncbi:unnamed protein product [Amoebophrya sp. A25]|nr:unnamed protein product [Amoebophrya sp. A25]|eukprot:GSA25T00005323001.1
MAVSSAAGAATSSKSSVATTAARQFLSFVNQTGSPYHSVAAVKQMLKDAKFEELREGSLPWRLQQGGRYFLTKHASTICAFVVGGQFNAREGGFVVTGGHTDSPCLRLRPNTKVSSGHKDYLQVGVQTYGGGLWHTWFDRPLGLAGKVVCRKGGGGLEEKLVRIDRPVLFIPNLAIHLQTADERKAFTINNETHLQPILCVNEPPSSSICVEAKPEKNDEENKHHSTQLLRLISDELGVQPSAILDMDLCLFDAEPSRLIGANEDFIYSGRIDNLASVFAQFAGLVEFANSPECQQSKDISVAAAFDHEEVGSESATGADSVNLENWLKQLLGECVDNFDHARKKLKTIINGTSAAAPTTCIPYDNEWLNVLSRSFLFSIDCAHGLHPNYSAKHQVEHRPLLHQGIVIKTNANQRYATTALTSALFRRVCELSDVKVQDFVVRNDCPCGSTIGPMVSSNLGMRSIDIGIPQWAMHSIKETCSSIDIQYLKDFCAGAYMHFREVDEQCASL